jgi:hypothetical protein
MRTVTPLLKADTLKLVYFTYFHSIIVTWNYLLGKFNKQQKNIYHPKQIIIRIMAGVKRRVSCRELFKKFNMLPLASAFLLSLLSFVADNMEKFK